MNEEAEEILKNADAAFRNGEITMEQWTDVRRLTLKSMLTIDRPSTEAIPLRFLKERTKFVNATNRKDFE